MSAYRRFTLIKSSAASAVVRPTQPWSYSLVLTANAVAVGVSCAPASLYGLYQTAWHFSSLTTTVIFAAYAVAALGAVLVSGKISDVVGRKPVMVAAFATMIIGLLVFLFADSVGMLLLARVLHGVAVGSIVVAGGAALLDIHPEQGARSGRLAVVAFMGGLAVAVLGSGMIARYLPDPLRTPYAVMIGICLLFMPGILMMPETHTARSAGPIRIARPAVPPEIRGDFWFSALGVMAAWTVLGVLLSLYPALATVRVNGHRFLRVGGLDSSGLVAMSPPG